MSGLGSLGTVAARIAAIEQRFTPPTGFAAALRQAETTPPAPAGGSAPGVVPAPVVTAPAFGVPPAGTLGGGLAPAPAGPAGAWASGLPPQGRAWAGAIEASARAAGVDPRLLASLVWAESGFRADARSHAGAVGLTQLMPGTARGLGVDPTDPAQNLAGGARYLREQLDRFGSPALALAAYNAGPGRVAQAGGIPNITETRSYVTRVLGYYDRLR